MRHGVRILVAALIQSAVAGLAVPGAAAADDAWRLTVREEDGVRWAGRGWAAVRDGLQVACFTGGPEEIGAQMYHLLVAPREQPLRAVFQQLQEMGKSGGPLVRLFKEAYARFKFIPLFKRVIPAEYLRELAGFKLAASNGADRSINDVLMANAFQDVTLVYGGCSFFAAWGASTHDGGMLVGRNLDYGALKEMAAYQSLNFYRPDRGLRFVTLGYPSFAGLMHGMNENGVVVAFTYSTAIKDEITVDGVPFLFILRQALQYGRDFDEAVAIVKRAPRTVGLNVLVADARQGKAAVLEVSAHRFAVRAEPDFLYAANRYRTKYMSQYQADGWLSSALRESRFQSLAAFFRGRLDVPGAVAVLRDKNDPETAGGSGLLPGIDNDETIASIVFDSGRLEVWAGARGGWMAPDTPFLGFSAREAWETGRPVRPLGTVPAAAETDYTRSWLAVMQAKTMPDREVIPLLAPVVDRYPAAEYPLLIMGRALLRTRQTEKGLSMLARLVSLPRVAEPLNLLEAHFWLGVFHDTLGDRAIAIEHYRAALGVVVPDLRGDYRDFRALCRKGLDRPLTFRYE